MKGWQALTISVPTWIISSVLIQCFAYPIDLLGLIFGVIILCSVVFLYGRKEKGEGEE